MTTTRDQVHYFSWSPYILCIIWLYKISSGFLRCAYHTVFRRFLPGVLLSSWHNLELLGNREPQFKNFWSYGYGCGALSWLPSMGGIIPRLNSIRKLAEPEPSREPRSKPVWSIFPESASVSAPTSFNDGLYNPSKPFPPLLAFAQNVLSEQQKSEIKQSCLLYQTLSLKFSDVKWPKKSSL